MPWTSATGSICSTVAAVTAAEIDRRAGQRDLPGLGPRQRQDLRDQGVEPVELLELVLQALALAHRSAGACRRASSVSPRRIDSGVRSSCASAALNCRMSPTARSTPIEREIERVGHFVELVAGAADRQPPAQGVDVDGPRRLGQARQRRQRAAGHPAAHQRRQQQAGGDAPQQQPLEAGDGTVGAIEGEPDLEQELVAVGAGDDAAGDAQPPAVGLDVVNRRRLAERRTLRRACSPPRPGAKPGDCASSLPVARS